MKAGYIPFTDDMKTELQGLQKLTGRGLRSILYGVGSRSKIYDTILKRSAVKKSDYDLLIDLYRKAVANKDYGVPTKEYLPQFHKELDRTGLKPVDIYRLSGVTSLVTYSNFMSFQRGKSKTVNLAMIERVLNALKEIPDKAVSVKTKTISELEERVTIEGDVRERLLHYREIGLLPSKIFKTMKYDPAHPKPSNISGWLNDGVCPKRSDLEFVLEACDSVVRQLVADI